MKEDDVLQFIGNGSAFNSKLGNNSAFIKDKENKVLILIDCGGDVFQKLINFNILEDVEQIHVVLTHLHPDHVGSLGDLIFYNYYIKNTITNIYYPEDDIVNLLTLMDVNFEFYIQVQKDEFTIDDYRLTRISQVHRGKQNAYGYLIQNSNVNLFYSGDSKTIPNKVLNMLENNKLDFLYQDVSTHDFEGNPHLSMNELLNLIPKDLRHKVICMHLDNDFNKEKAELEGLLVSKNILIKQ